MSMSSDIAAESAAKHCIRILEEVKADYPYAEHVIDDAIERINIEIIGPAKDGWY